MPTPLSFYIKPMTGELADRTLFAHTVRGIAYQLKSPASLPTPRHRLDFAFVLGLATHLRWYKPNVKTTDALHPELVSIILSVAANRWKRQLRELDPVSIELALLNLPAPRHDAAINMLALQATDESYFSPLFFPERYALMKPTNAIPQDVMDRLSMSLASLEASLLAKDPLMATHLRASHSLLISYPETVHLLDDAEIALIIDAAEVHTKTEIVKPGVSKAAGVGSRKKLGADDL